MELEQLRQQIDQCDDQIMQALKKRLTIVQKVAEFKQDHDLPVRQTSRMDQLVARLTETYGDGNLTSEFIAQLYQLIMEHAIQIENKH
jgi:chorismate mutase